MRKAKNSNRFSYRVTDLYQILYLSFMIFESRWTVFSKEPGFMIFYLFIVIDTSWDPIGQGCAEIEK